VGHQFSAISQFIRYHILGTESVISNQKLTVSGIRLKKIAIKPGWSAHRPRNRPPQHMLFCDLVLQPDTWLVLKSSVIVMLNFGA
jgi:hypothetical protein